MTRRPWLLICAFTLLLVAAPAGAQEATEPMPADRSMLHELMPIGDGGYMTCPGYRQGTLVDLVLGEGVSGWV